MTMWTKLFGGARSSAAPATLEQIRKAILEPGDATEALVELMLGTPDLNAMPPGDPVFPVMLTNGVTTVNYTTSPLILAAMLHKPERLRVLLRHGARTDVTCGHGRTPLHWAIVGEADSYILGARGSGAPSLSSTIAPELQAASLAATRILLEHGADVNAADGLGQTPLHRACLVAGKAEHIRLLLAKGALVDAETKLRVTPLSIAVQNELADSVAALLEGNANPNLPDSNGATALHYASARGNLELVQALVRAKADPHLADLAGHTPMSLGIGSGSLATVKLLHDADPSVTLPPNWRQNVLVNALRKCDTPTLEALLKVQDVNAPDEEGYTLLQRAVGNGVPEGSVSFLLTHGASIEAEDASHRRALHFAAALGHANLVSLLVRHGASLEAGDARPLHVAAGAGHLSSTKALLDVGADPKALRESWLTPLVDAVEGSHLDVARLLADAVAARGGLRTLPGASSLSAAVAKGNVQMVKMLLEYQPDVDATSMDGWTALHEAVAHSEAMVRMLLDAGANPNAPSEAGYTPLHRAVSKGRVDVVRLLLRAGADPKASDIVGNTAIEFAQSSGSAETIAAVATLCPPRASRSDEERQNRILETLRYHIARAPARLGLLRQHGVTLVRGGDGSTLDSPRLVNWKGLGTGVMAIYDFLDEAYGAQVPQQSARKGNGWVLRTVKTVGGGQRHIHQVEVALPDGSERAFFFDITQCAPPALVTAGLLAHFAASQARGTGIQHATAS